jgi:putative phosphoserine phosphatase/1-acylglycerol-3-phosphate O-acyltransferase
MAATVTLDELRAEIAGSPEGSTVAAFFDVDGAVCAGRLVSGRSRSPFRFGNEDPGAAVTASVRAWSGKEVAEVDEAGARAFARSVADRVYAEARELVATHRQRGHTVVLTSSATVHHLRPLADALGIDDVVCTDAEVVDGRLTGEVIDPVLVAQAKVTAVEKFVASHGIDLGRSHAYASGNDAVPLLSLVGAPHPVNPEADLAAAAKRNGWPVVRFDSRGRPAPETVARSLAAYGMMVPSMLGGVAIGLLNRDRHAIAEYGVNNWIERMFAVTGVSLRVHGETNLWSHRPAVFIFNHRNNFDPYVAIKLVRRDWGSVAKREIAGPLAGPMQWLMPGVAFIDRSDAEKAVEGLRPVTELLRSGVSVLVAPEGTRSRTGQLGRFKKGPFRMAMSAGVPVVPIVIHNADLVASREAGIIRSGTIDVSVLPPVPTDRWTLDDLDDHIVEVRQQYVDTLANWPQADAQPGEDATVRANRGGTP